MSEGGEERKEEGCDHRGFSWRACARVKSGWIDVRSDLLRGGDYLSTHIEPKGKMRMRRMGWGGVAGESRHVAQ